MREFFKKHLWLYRVYLCTVIVPLVIPIFLVETLWKSLKEFCGEWKYESGRFKYDIATMWRNGVG
jgi:hypothetical protein